MSRMYMKLHGFFDFLFSGEEKLRRKAERECFEMLFDVPKEKWEVKIGQIRPTFTTVAHDGKMYVLRYDTYECLDGCTFLSRVLQCGNSSLRGTFLCGDSITFLHPFNFGPVVRNGPRKSNLVDKLYVKLRSEFKEEIEQMEHGACWPKTDEKSFFNTS